MNIKPKRSDVEIAKQIKSTSIDEIDLILSNAIPNIKIALKPMSEGQEQYWDTVRKQADEELKNDKH